MTDLNTINFPRKLLERFILLYKELPCLWDRNCLAYKHKQKRHEALSKLTALIQEYDSSATRVHVLRKIESLRACIRREYKRVIDSRRNATSPDEIYTPHLWYYGLFSFVLGNDEVDCKVKKDRSHDEINVESEEEVIADDDDAPQSFEQSMDNFPIDYNPTTSMIEVTDVDSSKRYSTYDQEQSNAVKRHCTEIEDEYDAIGINVAAKLRNLPSNMRILAEKLINDVLFQAQINGLSPSTVITTPDPFK